MNIKIESEEDLLNKFKKAVHILNNLRYTTEDWKEKYGCEARLRKERWEKAADNLLEKLDPKHKKLKDEINIVNI